MTQTTTFSEYLDQLFHLPPRPRSRWQGAGLGPRGERILDIVAGVLLVLFTAGWTWAIVDERMHGSTDEDGATVVTSGVTAALTRLDAPNAAYITDAALRALTPLRGESGKLRVTVQEPGAAVVPDSLPAGARITYEAGGEVADAPAPPRSGIWNVALRVGSILKPISDLRVITMVPFSAKQKGRVGTYILGSWPTEGGRVKRAGYVTPSGFIEVTPENQDTYVSEHFRLRDFLTKGQANVWPKYLVLDTRLVDKMELVLSDLESRGIKTTKVFVMSAFRTPSYNSGGGDTRGRATLSRHMYGDAADIWIDADGDGRMDDLNRDGRVDIKDSKVIQDAVERVDRAHPELVGGAGIYPANSAHGPFIHIDVRGYRARWVGTGDG